MTQFRVQTLREPAAQMNGRQNAAVQQTLGRLPESSTLARSGVRRGAGTQTPEKVYAAARTRSRVAWIMEPALRQASAFRLPQGRGAHPASQSSASQADPKLPPRLAIFLGTPASGPDRATPASQVALWFNPIVNLNLQLFLMAAERTRKSDSLQESAERPLRSRRTSGGARSSRSRWFA